MVTPLYMESCTSFVTANVPEQADFCHHLKSNINFSASLQSLSTHLIHPHLDFKAKLLSAVSLLPQFWLPIHFPALSQPLSTPLIPPHLGLMT